MSLIARTELYVGRLGSFGLEEVRLPNGVTTELAVLRHPGAAAVLPLHDDGTVTLVRQHRHCTGGRLWEIPAGKIDGDEAPEICAARELAEEAGLAGTLRHLTTIWTAPAFTDERIALYVATDLRAVPSALEEDEVLDVVRLPLVEVQDMIARGELTDAKSLCAILLATAADGASPT